MIVELTEKQRKSINKYYKEGMKIGLDTNTDKDKTEKTLIELYKYCGYDKPFVFWCQSPYQMQLIINVLSQIESQIGSQIWSQIRSQIESQIWSQIWSQIRSQIESQIWSQIWSHIESQIGSQIWSQIGSQIWSQIESQIGSQIESQIESQIRSQIESQIWSQIWSQIESQIELQIRSQIGSQIELQIRSQIWSQIGSQIESQIRSQNLNIYLFYYGYSQNEIYWINYYRYFINNFKEINWNKKAIKGLSIIYDIAKYSGWWYPFENIVFVCEKPINILYDRKNNFLHSDKKSVVEYSDGYKIYALNGIIIPYWVIEKNKKEIDIKEIIKISNVEQKREIIKFLGEDWFFEKIKGKLLDSKYLYLDDRNKVYQKYSKNRHPIEYRLIEADIGLSEPIKILCMDNASIRGVKHYETVEPYCKTVLDAFESRTGIREYPVYLS